MSLKLFCLVTVALCAATVVHAEDVAIPRRATIFSAEGTKIGKVEQVVSVDGKPQAVKVIYRGKFVTIPAATLTSAEKGLMTSLSNETLKKM